VTNPTTKSPNFEIISQEPYAFYGEKSPLAQHPIELTDKQCHLARILNVICIEEKIDAPKRGSKGGQEIDRRPIAKAFVAKIFLRLPDTRTLIESLKQSPSLRQLCGMENVPSEPTFSRAFAQFAQQNLGDIVHRALVEKHVSPHVVMHASHDSTAVEAREKALAKKDKPQETKVKKSVVALRKRRFAPQKSQLVWKSR
jgi:Transposase domain (DUF772)